MTPDEWGKLDEIQQVRWWPAIPEVLRAQCLAQALPVTRIVLATPLSMIGDQAGDRIAIKSALRQHGYTVRDDEWLNRHCRIMEHLHYAQKNWVGDMTEAARDHWPAWCLRPRQGRMPPGTKERWLAAGGRIIQGKMMALKTDPVWQRFSKFGRPHPPFDPDDNIVTDSIDIDAAKPLLNPPPP